MRQSRLFSSAVTVTVLCLRAHAQPSLVGLDDGLVSRVRHTQSISDDGSVITGYASFAGGTHAFRWSQADGMVDLGVPPGRAGSFGEVISGDGRFILGDLDPLNHIFRWDAVSGIQESTVQSMGVVGVSRDGRVIAFSQSNDSSFRAWRWRTDTGDLELLPLPFGITASECFALSADGNIVGGRIYTGTGMDACLWIGDQFIDLPNRTNSREAYVLSLNGDGSVGVGASLDWPSPPDYNASSAVLWRRESDHYVMQELGRLAGYPFAEAYGTDCAGQTVIGWTAGTQAVGPGFIWRPELGMVSFQAFLISIGVANASEWSNLNPVAITPDGAHITGTGTHNFRDEAFVVTIPVPCSSDFDRDGDSGTDFDIESFFACLAGACPMCQTSDFDHDGDAGTDADIEAFFRVLAGGSC